jgi:hypothetical protein
MSQPNLQLDLDPHDDCGELIQSHGIQPTNTI